MSEIIPSPLRPLWFEPFLQQLSKTLGYAIDISKYAQLLSWSNHNLWTGDKFSFDRLYTVCRLLFLEHIDHEAVFNEIFLKYIISELDQEQIRLKPVPAEQLDFRNPNPITHDMPVSSIGINPIGFIPTGIPEPPDDEVNSTESFTLKKYLNINIPVLKEEVESSLQSLSGSRFLFNEAYLPLTNREMIHGWRHLRKSMRYKESERIDISASVEAIARDGILIEPVFEKEQMNNEDLLLILADRRGSMTPFHKLTDKLIETAIKSGGHRHALVYYFHNCPVNIVYKHPNLTDPVSLTELYAKMRPGHTNAVIISDAGAARGNMTDLRIKKLKEFLYGNDEVIGLHKSALFVAWINPMPRHRWVNTTASVIDRDPNTPMYSIMEDGYRNFLNIIEKLMGR